jgi:hypothetical protein
MRNDPQFGTSRSFGFRMGPPVRFSYPAIPGNKNYSGSVATATHKSVGHSPFRVSDNGLIGAVMLHGQHSDRQFFICLGERLRTAPYFTEAL